MVTSTPVAATFESSAPPQFPLATAFTELPCNPHPATITAFEELPSKMTKRTGGAALSDQIALRAPTPPEVSSWHSSPDDASSTKSSLDSGSSSCAHDGWDSEEGKIAKPDGQPGRPGSGGYNLADALSEFGWDAKAFKKLKVSLIFTRLILLC